jgi:Spy/CpxP family protein refolding chaperone
MMDPAQLVQRLDAVLNLTGDQKAKITDIYTKALTDMQALRSGGGSPEETMAKRQTIQTSTNDQIRALLTPDQQTKFDAMPPPALGRGGRRGGGPGGPGGNATPSP